MRKRRVKNGEKGEKGEKGENERSEPGHLKSGGVVNGQWTMENVKWQIENLNNLTNLKPIPQ